MKLNLWTSMLVLVCAVLAGGVSSAEKKKNDKKDVPSNAKELTFPITGMMCGNCESSVVTTMKKVEGVIKATADQDTGKAVVSYDPTKTDADKILEYFKKNKLARFEGYKPGETPPKPNYTYSGKEETLSGRLSVKALNAPSDVVARVMAHRKGEPNERLINLIATGEMAKRVEEVRKMGVPVKIKGVVSDEGIKVADIQP